MNPFIPPAMGWIVPELFSFKDGFDIKKTHEICYRIKQRNQTKPVFLSGMLSSSTKSTGRGPVSTATETLRLE